MPYPPRIERLGNGASHLIVDGKPFLVRAGELHNSSLSSPSYMSGQWSNLKAMGLNTVLGSVSWEQIEPKEGVFDFKVLDEVIYNAHEHGLKMVLLWFGSFKNGKLRLTCKHFERFLTDHSGMSTYPPRWVRTDTQRFPRAMIQPAEGSLRMQDALSVFHDSAIDADARAFKTLMAHIKEVDVYHTVIAVQIENECGLLGDSRDRNEAANRAFAADVPIELVETLSREWDSCSPRLRANLANFTRRVGGSSSWEQTFGKGTHVDELFMAYHYAKYVDRVAAAGKSVNPLPFFTNVWLANDEDDGEEEGVKAGGGSAPGVYPSGGPVSGVLDIWQVFAPHLDFIAPDIYLMDYEAVCASYSSRQQSLFIPEQRRDEYGALRIWSAIGTYNALGASPFGIDSEVAINSPLTTHYALLGQVAPHILSARTEGRQTYGFFFDSFASGAKDPSAPRTVIFGQWELTISRAIVFGHPQAAFGLVIQLPDREFMLIGEGYQVAFKSLDPAAVHTGLATFREQEIVNEEGQLRDGKWYNGDEAVALGPNQVARMPSFNPDGGSFVIGILTSATTRIAKVEPYYLIA